MAAILSTDRSANFEAPRGAPPVPVPGRAASAPVPRLIDDGLMTDFLTAVQALPWASARESHAELIEAFVWLGWLRRDGAFIGLTEEGARLYTATAPRP